MRLSELAVIQLVKLSTTCSASSVVVGKRELRALVHHCWDTFAQLCCVLVEAGAFGGF